MTNKEKEQFILDVNKLTLKHRLNDPLLSTSEYLIKEKLFWADFSKLFYDKLPKTLYKYRKPTEYAFQNFEKDEAWFSHPSDFDETTDSTINNNIEEEIKEFKENPYKSVRELASSFAAAISKKQGFSVEEKQFDDALKLFYKNGKLNESGFRFYLYKKYDKESAERILKVVKEKIGDFTKSQKTIKTIKKSLDMYCGLNDEISSRVYTFSLAEKSDSQLMWSTYGDESRGFCIEYEFPCDTVLGKRMLMNLLPIFYGNKPLIKFFEIIIKRSQCSKNTVAGMDFDDFQTIFLSTFTKDADCEAQREWRITFNNRFGDSLREFPFIKSVILGERMNDEHKERILKAAQEKNIPVYERQPNYTKSAIIVKRIL